MFGLNSIFNAIGGGLSGLFSGGGLPGMIGGAINGVFGGAMNMASQFLGGLTGGMSSYGRMGQYGMGQYGMGGMGMGGMFSPFSMARNMGCCGNNFNMYSRW